MAVYLNRDLPCLTHAGGYEEIESRLRAQANPGARDSGAQGSGKIPDRSLEAFA
jgi:hypothetical protein